MAINRSPMLTIPGMMGPRTTTNRATAIVAPQQSTPVMYPGRPLNTMQPGPAVIESQPPRPTNVEPMATGPMSVHGPAPVVDYAPQRPVDDVANSQAALSTGGPMGRMPAQGGSYTPDLQQQAVIHEMTYGNYTSPSTVQNGGTAGNSGIVPPGLGRQATPELSPAPPSTIEPARLAGAPMASGSTMPGMPRAPTMPVNTALRQQPTTSTGLPVNRPAATGRPAGGMFPRLG